MRAQTSAICFECGWQSEPWQQSDNREADGQAHRNITEEADAHRFLFHTLPLSWLARRLWPAPRIPKWNHKFDVLSDYNGQRNLAANSVNAETRERYRKIIEGYSPEFVASMKALQDEYNATMHR